MKCSILITGLVCFALLSPSCRWSLETSFFSKFSTRQLLKNYKSAGLDCDNSIAGGGGGGARIGAWGFGQSNYNSSKSDSCGCSLNPDEAFDEAALFSALKIDVERMLGDSGAKIISSGSTGQANFYFAYTLKNVNGRVELSGTRSGNHFYNVMANLNESGN